MLQRNRGAANRRGLGLLVERNRAIAELLIRAQVRIADKAAIAGRDDEGHAVLHDVLRRIPQQEAAQDLLVAEKVARGVDLLRGLRGGATASARADQTCGETRSAER